MLVKKLFSDASQANLASKYRNVRIKISTITADIKFNKNCLKHNVTPKYAKIKIKSNSKAALRTKHKAEQIYVENMIEELYSKKDELLLEAYNIHLNFEKNYGPVAWNLLHSLVKIDLEEISERKYEKLENKLKELIDYNHKFENESDNDPDYHSFQKRIVNLTDLTLNQDETKLLNYGLKHNFNQNSKTQNEILATDIEANARNMKNVDRNEVRHTIVNNINNENKHHNEHKNIKDLKQCIQLKNKLEENNLLAIKADKSNSIVLIEKEEYVKKTEAFISENNFKQLDNDPTIKYKAKLNTEIKKCKHVITEDMKPKLYVPNPKAPTMKGLPKIHKEHIPIRPLVNYRSAPAYKISKFLASTLTSDLNLENKHSIKNSYDLVNKIKNVNIKGNTRLVSYDITNMYTNVPVNEVLEIIERKLTEKAFDKAYAQEIRKLLQIVLDQNYFRFNNKYYVQTNGLTMGSPLSSILSEIFLQENENIILEKLMKSHDIAFYTRYVDDILIAYHEKTPKEDTTILEELNRHHNNLKFTEELENNGKINYLDLTITKKDEKLSFSIFRKPTQTDTVINQCSTHPISHKTASFRAMLYRAYKIPLSTEERDKEIKIIKKIAKQNGYNQSLIDKIGNKIKKKINNKERLGRITTLKPEKEEKETPFVTFTYTGTTSQKIANKFKKFNVSIAFRTTNTIQNILKPKIERESEAEKFNKSGVYKISCNNCEKYYVGQTKNFNERYKNHTSAWRNRKPERSNVAKHLINCNHEIGQIENNMEILKVCEKGQKLNAWEEMYIYKEKHKSKSDLINEQIQFDSDIIFDKLIGNYMKTKTSHNNQKPTEEEEREEHVNARHIEPKRIMGKRRTTHRPPYWS